MGSLLSSFKGTENNSSAAHTAAVAADWSLLIHKTHRDSWYVIWVLSFALQHLRYSRVDCDGDVIIALDQQLLHWECVLPASSKRGLKCIK